MVTTLFSYVSVKGVASICASDVTDGDSMISVTLVPKTFSVRYAPPGADTDTIILAFIICLQCFMICVLLHFEHTPVFNVFPINLAFASQACQLLMVPYSNSVRHHLREYCQSRQLLHPLEMYFVFL